MRWEHLYYAFVAVWTAVCLGFAGHFVYAVWKICYVL